jgi:anaerobic ribonucleoside-triphosphate reductase
MSDTTTIETTTATAALTDSERQPCEIWTRVMGYHRPLASFNSGKKGEFAERVCFAENSADNS